MGNPNPDTSGLTPFPPGVSGNPSGRAKGSKNLSTIIKNIMEHEIDWKLVNVKDAKKWEIKYKNKSAWEAVIYVAFVKAMTGDVRAMEWLAKAGYGEKYVHEAPDVVGEVLKRFGLPTGDDNAGQTEDSAS